MRHYILLFMLVFLASTLCIGCKEGSRGFNLFTIQDDKALGMQLRDEIAANPQQYPVLDPAQFPEAYGYLFRIRDKILNSGKVDLADEFDWETRIIADDNTLNAFVAPGGYIYVFTGLIKYLDTEDELAGVMGHEIAHADRRHSTEQLTKAFGITTLVDIVLGDNQNTITQVLESLVSLKFSRDDESEADEYSVIYLCPTDYNAAGAAGFFEKIAAEGSSSPPQFLSTHPNPDNRVENIYAKETELGCNGTGTFDAQYQNFKNSLP